MYHPLLLSSLLLAPLVALAQNAPGEVELDPNAQCAQDVRDRITSCLDQVERDETGLSGGPCTSTDWSCICTKQQGMVDCYSPCPGLQPVDMLQFNQGNCQGQHGVTIKAEGGTLAYTWSGLPFTSTSTSPPDLSDAAITPDGATATGDNSTASIESYGTPAPDSNSTAALSPTSNNATRPLPPTSAINTTAHQTNRTSPDGASSVLASVPLVTLYATVFAALAATLTL